jgi:hypothetical protein
MRWARVAFRVGLQRGRGGIVALLPGDDQAWSTGLGTGITFLNATDVGFSKGKIDIGRLAPFLYSGSSSQPLELLSDRSRQLIIITTAAAVLCCHNK